MQKKKKDLSFKFLKEALSFAQATCQEAGEKLAFYFRKNLAKKRGSSKEVKSIYDEILDRFLIKKITKKYPHHSILTEETGWLQKESDFLWIVDPIDGTSNFENHNPFFAISLALAFQGDLVLSCIEAPILKERFLALKNKGAFKIDLERNKKEKIKVSNLKDLKESYILFCEGGERERQRIVKAFSKFYPKVKELRKLGSAALETAWVATGRAEAYFTFKIRLWDIAGGFLLVKEAKGRVLDFKGGKVIFKQLLKDPLSNLDLVFTNSKVKVLL